MGKEKVHLSIRINTELHDRFQYVAGAEGRTMSGQILYLMQRCVREFEKTNGPIKTEDMEKI